MLIQMYLVSIYLVVTTKVSKFRAFLLKLVPYISQNVYFSCHPFYFSFNSYFLFELPLSLLQFQIFLVSVECLLQLPTFLLQFHMYLVSIKCLLQLPPFLLQFHMQLGSIKCLLQLPQFLLQFQLLYVYPSCHCFYLNFFSTQLTLVSYVKCLLQLPLF